LCFVASASCVRRCNALMCVCQPLLSRGDFFHRATELLPPLSRRPTSKSKTTFRFRDLSRCSDIDTGLLAIDFFSPSSQDELVTSLSQLHRGAMSTSRSVRGSRRPPKAFRTRHIHHTRVRQFLFAFEWGRDHYRCELHDHPSRDIEARLFKNDECIRTRQFATRAEATAWAMVHRDAILKG
jgi:hypothetical protein